MTEKWQLYSQTGDILERAKKALIDDDMTYEDYNECISLLIADVERLRSRETGLETRLEWTIRNQVKDRDGLVLNQAARIKGLEAKFAEVQSLYDAMHKLSTIEGAMKAEAYVKMLEAAFLKAETERKFYTTINGMSSDFDWQAYPEKPPNGIHKDWFRDQARAALEEIKAETGSGDHVVGVNKLILTAEQREAIEIALEYLVDDPNDGGDFEIPKAIKGLRDLLNGKAGGKDE